MIRDYISHELQGVSNQIEDLSRQEREVLRPENRQKRDEAEGRAKRIRENLGVNPFYRTQEEVNFLINQARASVPRRSQMSSQVARSSQCA
jgi:hypothetical protein